MRLASAAATLVLGLLAISATQPAHSQSDPTSAPRDVLETVLVTGEQPGPALWQVSKDGKVLWIVGTFGPLSQRMTWRSGQVAAILQQSQELYTEPLFETFLGNGAEERKLLEKAMQNEAGSTLRDALPADLYERFDMLREKYAGGGRRFEELRPFVAAQRLQEQAMRRLSLSGDGGVRAKVLALARRHRVKIRSLRLVDNSRARAAVLDLDAVPRQADVACLQAQLARLETELNEAALRANAWASGDVAELRRLLVPTSAASSTACQPLLMSSAVFEQGIAEANRRADGALRKALQRNRSTVALMPIEMLFAPDGLLARFRRDGFQVDEPEMPR